MFKRILCFALLAQLGVHSFYTEDETRMAGGSIVSDPSTFSYQVAIQPLRTEQGQLVKLPVCSGILIKGADSTGDKYYILTSGQCGSLGSSFNLWAGTNKVLLSTTPDGVATASDVILHKGFLENLQTDDLAVIAAPASIQTLIENTAAGTGTKTVTVATLVRINSVTNNYLASSVKMAGWGYPNDVFNAASPSLRSVSSRVVPNSYCTAIHFGKPISSKHLCTGGLINKGPCTGDSGAPLILDSDNSIIGLATLTPDNGCSKGKPGVFTRLGHYLAWIVSVTNYDPEQ